MVNFNEEKMKKLAKEDLYIMFVWKDLKMKNKHMSDKEILEVIFNGNVLNDSVYEAIYKNL